MKRFVATKVRIYPTPEQECGFVRIAGCCQLTYKLSWKGGTLIEVPAAHSSRECAECGHTEKDNRRGQRFACRKCLHEDHADTNALRVIKRRALTQLGVLPMRGNADPCCAEGVRAGSAQRTNRPVDGLR